MHAQRQLAVAAVRAEVKRHEVAKQALNRLRKLAEKVGDSELRDSIQASLNSVRVPAIRASDDNTGRKCCHGNTMHHILLPTLAFNPVVGPWQEQLIYPPSTTTKELMELEVSLDCSHLITSVVAKN